MVLIQVELHLVELHAIAVAHIPEIDPAAVVVEVLPVSFGTGHRVGHFIRRVRKARVHAIQERHVQIVQRQRGIPAQRRVLRRIHDNHVLIGDAALIAQILDVVVLACQRSILVQDHHVVAAADHLWLPIVIIIVAVALHPEDRIDQQAQRDPVDFHIGQLIPGGHGHAVHRGVEADVQFVRIGHVRAFKLAQGREVHVIPAELQAGHAVKAGFLGDHRLVVHVLSGFVRVPGVDVVAILIVRLPIAVRAQGVFEIVPRQLVRALVGGQAVRGEEYLPAVQVHIERFRIHRRVIHMISGDPNPVPAAAFKRVVRLVSGIQEIVDSVNTFPIDFEVDPVFIPRDLRHALIKLQIQVKLQELMDVKRLVRRQDHAGRHGIIDIRIDLLERHEPLGILLAHVDPGVIAPIICCGCGSLPQQHRAQIFVIGFPGQFIIDFVNVRVIVSRFVKLAAHHLRARAAEQYDALDDPFIVIKALRANGHPVHALAEREVGDHRILDAAGQIADILYALEVIADHFIRHSDPVLVFEANTVIPIHQARRHQLDGFALNGVQSIIELRQTPHGIRAVPVSIDDVQIAEFSLHLELFDLDQVHHSAPLRRHIASDDLDGQRIRGVMRICRALFLRLAFKDRQGQDTVHGVLIGDDASGRSAVCVEAVGDAVARLQAGDGRGDAHVTIGLAGVPEAVDVGVFLQGKSHRLGPVEHAEVIDALLGIDQRVVVQLNGGAVAAGLAHGRRGGDVRPFALRVQPAVQEAVVRVGQRHLGPRDRGEHPRDHGQGRRRAVLHVVVIRRGQRQDHRVIGHGEEAGMADGGLGDKGRQIRLVGFGHSVRPDDVGDDAVVLAHGGIVFHPDRSVAAIIGVERGLAPVAALIQDDHIAGQQPHGIVPAAIDRQSADAQRAVGHEDRGLARVPGLHGDRAV